MAQHRWHDENEWGDPVSMTVRGVMQRVVASVLVPVVWLSLTLLYLGFWAHGLSLFQEVVVGVVSVLALLAALVVLWISFGVRLYHRWVNG